MDVLPAASLTLILGSLEPLPQNGAQCFSLGKYTLYGVAHDVKRPNHLMEGLGSDPCREGHKKRGQAAICLRFFPSPTQQQSC